MAKRKIPVKSNPVHKQKPDLFGGTYQVLTKDMKSEKFMSDLQVNGFLSKHKYYFSNYINGDYSIGLGHIKRAYENYVLTGNWKEDKFMVVLEEIIKNRLVMTTSRFIDYGQKYDKGELNKSSWMGTDVQSNTLVGTASNDDDILEYIRQELGKRG